MKKIVGLIACLMIIVTGLYVCKIEIHADDFDVDVYTGAAVMCIANGLKSEAQVADDLIRQFNNGSANAGLAADWLVQHGYCVDYIDEFKAAGIMINSSGNSIVSSQPKQKTEYTIQDVEPYSAWATKDCNIRNGADTTYDKVGSLKKYDKVTVTGVASTGWYRIVTESGIEAYVSNTLVTTENPSNRTVTVVNENGDEATYEFSDTPPEVIDEIVENIENPEQEHEHSYTEAVTTQPTCSSVGTKTYTCEECGDTYTEEISKTEHVAGEWEITKEPTFTKEGKMVKKCTVCGEILETQKIAPKTNILVGIIVGAVAIMLILIGYVVKRKRNK